MRLLLAIPVLLLPLTSFCQKPDTSAHTLKGVTVTEHFFQPEKWGRSEDLQMDSAAMNSDEDLVDVLMQNTGVFIRSQGIGGVGSISMRGTSAYHTMVFWNGLNIQSPTLGQFDASLIPTGAADRLEVNYGASGLEYGSGGLGGSIHLSDGVRKDTSVHLNGMLSYGSFKTASGRLEAHIPVSQRVFIKVGAGGDFSENNLTYPDVTTPGQPTDTLTHASGKRVNGGMALAWIPGKSTEINVHANATGYEREVPPMLTQSAVKDENLNDQMFMSVASLKTALRRTQLYLSTGMVKSHNLFENKTDSLTSQTNFTSWQTNIRQSMEDILFSNLSMEWGAQLFYDVANSDGFEDRKTQWRNGIYLASNYDYNNRVWAHALVRQDIQDTSNSPLLYAFSVEYTHPKWGEYALRTSRNYRFPTLNERYWINSGNPDLLPESAVTHELNASKRFQMGLFSMQMGMAMFYSDVTNWIQWQPEGNTWSPVNYKAVESRGVEVFAGLDIKNDELSVSGKANYTYVVSQTSEVYFDSEPVGNDLLFTPRHRLSGSVMANWKQIQIRYRQGYTNKYYPSSDNYGYMPSYSVADVSLGYDVMKEKGRSLFIRVLVRNLWDWKYQVMPYRPEPGRNFHFQIQYRL